MLSLTNDQLIGQMQLQTRLAHMNLDGFTHEQSCLAPAGGNSANWILGHLIVSRDDIVEMLGGKKSLSAELHARYGAGSKPVSAVGCGETNFADLLKLWDAQAPALYKQIEQATPATYAQEVTRRDGSKTVLAVRALFYLIFHEGTHLGQLEYARHAAGKHEPLI